MKISFAAKPAKDTDLYLIAVAPGEAQKIKGPNAAIVQKLLAAHPDFKAEAGEVITAVVSDGICTRVGLAGVGKSRNQSSLETVGGKIMGKVMASKIKTVFLDGKLKAADAAAIATGARLRAYEFQTYKTKKKESALPETFTLTGGAPAQKIFSEYAITAEAVHWARDLVNEPSNVLYPDSFAKRVADKLKPLGVKITIMNEEQLEKKGFGAMIAVGKASEYPPRLVLMEYVGKGAKKGAPVALVGKGITFDSGGYSIKPSDSMIEMKCDMAGAAAVAGAFYALAKSKAKAHVVGALAMAENMISDEGYKPSDILTSLSGQTIEVTNTDAEGRLVLCDTLTHVQDVFKPRAIVDIATLTGAAMVALGEEYAGLFANDDGLRNALERSSSNTGDKVWRLPLDAAFDRAMDSSVADMKNASSTRYGGSSTGAAFLNRFIKDGVKWAHVDMAPTMVTRADQAICPKGATGFGVRLLADWAAKA